MAPLPDEGGEDGGDDAGAVVGVDVEGEEEATAETTSLLPPAGELAAAGDEVAVETESP